LVRRRPVTPKYFAPVDPAARWTAASGGLAFSPTQPTTLIDLDHAVIVEVEASSAVRQAEGHRRQDHDRASS